MLKKRESTRKYRLSDAQLKQTADQLLVLLDRDAIGFADRNFTQTKRTEFQNAITNFHNIESDEILEGQKIARTEEKNEAREILIRKMRTASLIAKLVFGATSGKYRTFGDVNYTDQSDDALCKNAKTMITACNMYLLELEAEGMTLQRIQELEDAKNNFDEAIDKQVASINRRDIATSTRIDMGNTLYELVAKYAEIGKDIWYSENEAHYNDYLIYDNIKAIKTEGNEADNTANDNPTV